MDLGSDYDGRQGNSIVTKGDPVVTDWQFKGPETAVALCPLLITAGAPHMGEHLQMALLLGLLIAYVAVGSAVALAFVIVGVTQVQPTPVTVGARILLLPGAFVLWPLVVVRWHKSRGGGR